jgi:gas vesicle structural protein
VSTSAFVDSDNRSVSNHNRASVTLEREAGSRSIIDVLDRVLDKGIVIDAWVRLSVVGIDLLTIEARMVVASIETYLNYAGSLSDVIARRLPAPTLSRQ